MNDDEFAGKAMIVTGGPREWDEPLQNNFFCKVHMS